MTDIKIYKETEDITIKTKEDEYAKFKLDGEDYETSKIVIKKIAKDKVISEDKWKIKFDNVNWEKTEVKKKTNGEWKILGDDDKNALIAANNKNKEEYLFNIDVSCDRGFMSCNLVVNKLNGTKAEIFGKKEIEIDAYAYYFIFIAIIGAAFIISGVFYLVYNYVWKKEENSEEEELNETTI